MTIKELVEKAHENARKHGFWEDWDSICWEDGLPKREDSTLDMEELFNNAIATRLMLIVSELGEALEAFDMRTETIAKKNWRMWQYLGRSMRRTGDGSRRRRLEKDG